MTESTTIYGIRNCAAFNLRPRGDVDFYSSKAERDEALEQQRAQAISRGLSKSAAPAGIVPVSLTDVMTDVGEFPCTAAEWLESYEDKSDHPGEQAQMLDEVGL